MAFILLGLATGLVVIPALYDLILSLITYTPLRGLWGSPFAGLLLLPAFVPATVYFLIITRIFSSTVLIQSSTYILAFAAQQLFPGAAVIAFAGAVAGMVYRAKGLNPVHGALHGCFGAGLLARQFGLLNTVLPTALAVWLLPPVLLVILVFSVLLRYSPNRKPILFLSLGAACLLAATVYGGFWPNILFNTQPNLWTMGSLLRAILSGSGA